jgi:hypothetical protein
MSVFGVFLLTGLWPSLRAQAALTATATSQHHEAPRRQKRESSLVKVVGESTARFRDASVTRNSLRPFPTCPVY